MIGLRDKLYCSNEVLSQEINSETVLLDMNSENYFGLNEVGTQVWELLKNGTDLQSALKYLQGKYEVDTQILDSDIRSLLDELLEAGLITLEDKKTF